MRSAACKYPAAALPMIGPLAMLLEEDENVKAELQEQQFSQGRLPCKKGHQLARISRRLGESRSVGCEGKAYVAEFE